MLLIDSSAWIEWLADTPTARRLEAHMPAPVDCVVPTIVQLEVYKWLMRERSAEEASAFLAYCRDCVVIELTTPLAVSAADVSQRYRLANADAIIYATAIDSKADLLTCDAHFEGLPGVIHVDKAS